MKLNVILPYTYGGEDRQQNTKTVVDCIINQTYKDFRLVAIEEVQNDFAPHLFPLSDKLTEHIILRDNRPFNKSWLINVALKQSPYEDNIIIDCDMVFKEDFFQKIVDFREANIERTKIFSCYNVITSMPGRDNPKERTVKFDRMNAMGGVWYVNKSFFFNEIGGAHENYFAYGAEDNDIWFRAKYVNGQVLTMNYHLIHSYHHWSSPSPTRISILRTTEKYPSEIINRLKAANVGNPNSPTLIDIEDIKQKGED